MVRMKDVAKYAGVSVATVSNVITGKQVVSPQMREVVQRAINELNYNVNLVARGLKTQRTYTIGVLLPDVTKLFFNDVVKGIMETAKVAGYSINILSSNYDFETERSLVYSLKGSQVDGIILDSCADRSYARVWAEELLAERNEMPPVVALESTFDAARISAVLVDGEYWSGAITQHLIDSGRKRIFFISGPVGLEHEYARLTGYRNTLVKNGIALDENLIARCDFLSGTAYHAARKALEAGLAFDAIQASNDQAAIGAIKALKEYRIRIPDDVAVCGFDNLFPSTLITPAITTIDVPRYEMGARAVQEAIRRIEDKDAAPVQHVIEAGMIIRSSSCRNAVTQWNLENW
ncbi:MAG TPA: LacI family DNA-binding transcriptional regulator [Feifaniaceae bacterium]|nr:LacI family DNA-binding transcriptional regulator [Feifaniaceae bacterium]